MSVLYGADKSLSPLSEGFPATFFSSSDHLLLISSTGGRTIGSTVFFFFLSLDPKILEPLRTPLVWVYLKDFSLRPATPYMKGRPQPLLLLQRTVCLTGEVTKNVLSLQFMFTHCKSSVVSSSSITAKVL